MKESCHFKHSIFNHFAWSLLCRLSQLVHLSGSGIRGKVGRTIQVYILKHSGSIQDLPFYSTHYSPKLDVLNANTSMLSRWNVSLLFAASAILLDLPFLPNTNMKTSASVPAPCLSPVWTRTSYSMLAHAQPLVVSSVSLWISLLRTPRSLHGQSLFTDPEKKKNDGPLLACDLNMILQRIPGTFAWFFFLRWFWKK